MIRNYIERASVMCIFAAGLILCISSGCQTKSPAGLIGPQLGEYFYSQKCAACHGIDGKGQTRLGQKLKVRDHTDPAWQSSTTDQAMKTMIMDGKGKMPAFGRKFDTEELHSLIQFIRSVKH